MPGLVHADRGAVGIGQLFYQVPTAPGPTVSLPPRPVILAGRQDLLVELRARLSEDNGPRPRIAVLFGMGGVGKTSLAIEYAHQALEGAAIAWQLPAERPSVLAAEFGRLAAQLGGVGGPLDPRDPVASVHAVLAAIPGRWLLLFDNAPDQESVQAFLPPAGNGEVLITSQSPYWASGQAFEVPVLSPDAAADLLTARAGDPHLPNARKLAQKLGFLPLALEQAAAYILATGGTFASYLALFRDHRSGLLARGSPPGYGKTIATTWSLAFTELEEHAPNAVTLLRLLACCAPEPVPVGLLLRPSSGTAGQLPVALAGTLAPLLEDPLANNDAVAELRRFSLITFAGGGQILVHRLVQAVTLERMPPEQIVCWRQATASLIEAAIPADPTLPDAWQVFAALLPHSQAVLGYDSDGMERTARYLQYSGNYAGARDLWRKITDSIEQNRGPEHSRSLRARISHAYMTNYAGDSRAARDLLVTLVPVFQRTLGPEHPDTVTASIFLADTTGDTGDPRAARDLLATLVPTHERSFGLEHPATLAARSLLATYTGRAGDPGTARDMFMSLVSACERILGTEHPETLRARVNLAGWTGRTGDSAAARDQYKALLPICEKVLGPEHPRTLSVRRFLAEWVGIAGNPAAARDQFAALIPVTERTVGPRHRDTLSVRRNLAEWIGRAGNPAAARDQFGALISITEHALGADHPDTLSDRRSLAEWTTKAQNAGSHRGRGDS